MRGLAILEHAWGLWLSCILISWEASYLVHRAVAGPAWGSVMWGVVPLAILLAVSFPRKLPAAYLTWGGAPIGGYLLLWIAASSFSGSWDPSPLPYLPLMSPVDLTVLLALASLLLWHSRAAASLEEHDLSRNLVRVAVAISAFIWTHGVVFRAAHFGLDVSFHPEAMFDSVVVQTAIAVLWAATGLGCMVAGTKRNLRPLWGAGAALMAAVVAKLFLVDLSHTGTVARIVSFIGVGVVLLIVGYLSPVPPRERSAT
jgi:uncharacterized membrane protein